MTAEEMAKAPDPAERLWTVDDLTRRWSVSRSTLYGWVATGYLPHVRLGALLRFDPEATRAWEKSRNANVRSLSR